MSAHEILGFHAKMELHLVAKLVIDCLALEEGASATKECAHHRRLPREDSVHRRRKQPPLGLFGGEVLFALGGQGVELRAAAFVADAPVGLDPTSLLEAIERGIEATLADLENVGRELSDALRDAPAVERAESQGAQDEEVESALEELGAIGHIVVTLSFDNNDDDVVVVECQGNDAV